MSVLDSPVSVSIVGDYVNVVVQPVSAAGGSAGTPLQSITTNTQLTVAAGGQRFNNGLSTVNPVTVTLPPSSTIQPGWSAKFRVTSAALFTVAASAGDAILFDSFSAPSLGCAQVGSSIEVEYQGGWSFLVLPWVGPWG